MPVIRRFAGCQEGEKYPAFKLRLLQFYGDQIEALLTGDPDNISTKPVWVDALASIDARGAS